MCALPADLSPDADPVVSLNPLVRGLGRSATLAINERYLALKAAGVDAYQMGFGQSPFPVPPSVVEALRQNAHRKMYLPVQGLPELRQAIADYYRRTEGVQYSPDHVLVGPGSKELMFILQLVCEAEVLIPSPSWVSYAPQANIVGRKVHWLPTRFSTGLRITPEQLDTFCSEHGSGPRLLFINYPGNPTGTSYAAGELQGIAEVARRHRVLILSDEIYSGLHFSGQHVSLARFYPEGTIVSNGLSKWCAAGGWRLGTFLIPDNLAGLVEAMAIVASETFTSVAAPVQYAAVTGFSGGADVDAHIDGSRRIMASVIRHMAGHLRRAGAELCEPDGGFYLFPRFSDASPRFTAHGRPSTAVELCQRVLNETGVAMLPGNEFGRPPHELSARIAAVDFDGAAALEALANLGTETIPDEEFLRSYCPRAVQGIERLCSWLGSA